MKETKKKPNQRAIMSFKIKKKLFDCCFKLLHEGAPIRFKWIRIMSNQQYN